MIKKYVLADPYIERLDLSNRNLTSIQGIGQLQHLKELNLSGNLLTDVQELNALKELITLDLSFNLIRDISFEINKLEKLNVAGNQLTSLHFIKPLTQLTYLNVRSNAITCLTPISSLQNLKLLNIRDNQVQSLDALKEQVNLRSLNIRDNCLTSIEPLIELPIDERLYVSGNEIEDLHLLDGKLKTIREADFHIEAPKPTFSKASGVYKDSFLLELKAADGHEIYYTLDGSKPTKASYHYTTPIKISLQLITDQKVLSNVKTSPLQEGLSFSFEEVQKAVVVTAVSADGADRFSASVSCTYVLDPSLFESGLPVISFIVDPDQFFDEEKGIYVPGVAYEKGALGTGNYYGRGRGYEKEGVIDYFNGDSTFGFQQTIGIRINGSYTRRLPQKSLRLYPRARYGQSKIHFNLFRELPYNTFKRIVLRNGGNDYYSTYIRDGLMHELIKDRNLDVQAYQPSIVLLNGEYWGLHNIREKFTKDYICTKYNVKKSDLVMMSVDSKNGLRFKMDAGSEEDRSHFDTLIEYVKRNDMTKDEHVHFVATFMDIANYLEYVAAQVYYANMDSFHNNMTIWRKRSRYIEEAPKGHDGRWRWMIFDLDWGMGYRIEGQGDPMTFNMLNHVLREDPSVLLFRRLMLHEGTRRRFIETMLTLLNTNFEMRRVQAKIDELAAAIRPEIPQSIKRWGNIESVEVWENNIGDLHQFAEIRPSILKEHLMQAFDLTTGELDEMERQVKVDETKSNLKGRIE